MINPVIDNIEWHKIIQYPNNERKLQLEIIEKETFGIPQMDLFDAKNVTQV